MGVNMTNQSYTYEQVLAVAEAVRDAANDAVLRPGYVPPLDLAAIIASVAPNPSEIPNSSPSADQRAATLPYTSISVDVFNACCEALRSDMGNPEGGSVSSMVQAVLQAARASQPAQEPVTIPDAIPMEPYQTIDRSSKNYKAGWNACRIAVINSAPQPPAAAVPEGWQWVPKEPTAQMYEAGSNAGHVRQTRDGSNHEFVNPDDVYAAMLAAAPKPENKL
jgi:hypothetical protein